jgi:hypothetical protein
VGKTRETYITKATSVPCVYLLVARNYATSIPKFVGAILFLNTVFCNIAYIFSTVFINSRIISEIKRVETREKNNEDQRNPLQ